MFGLFLFFLSFQTCARGLLTQSSSKNPSNFTDDKPWTTLCTSVKSALIVRTHIHTRLVFPPQWIDCTTQSMNKWSVQIWTQLQHFQYDNQTSSSKSHPLCSYSFTAKERTDVTKQKAMEWREGQYGGKTSQSICTAGRPLSCYHPHPPSPIIIIT